MDLLVGLKILTAIIVVAASVALDWLLSHSPQS